MADSDATRDLSRDLGRDLSRRTQDAIKDLTHTTSDTRGIVLDWEDAIWAQEKTSCPKKPAQKNKTWVQVKIPSLRANGLPSKRATLSVSRAPKDYQIASQWTWNQSKVQVCTLPFDACTNFRYATDQYFVGAYLPSKFTDGQVVWGDRLWFQFDSTILSKWLGPTKSVKEPDVWFHDFLESEIEAYVP